MEHPSAAVPGRGQARSERERLFELLVERAPDPVARFDRQLRHLYVNAAAERFTGMPRERLLGRAPGELALPAELGDAWRRWVEAAFASGREERFELQYRAPEGRVAYEVRAIPEPGEGGAVEAVVTVLRDVTGRLRAERSAERAARLQAVTATLSEATSVEQAVPRVLEQVMAALGASASVVYLLDKAGEALEVVEALGYAERQRAGFGRIPLEAPLPLAEAVRTGEPVWLPSVEETAARYPHLGTLFRGDMGGAVAIPLVVDGRALGAVGLSFDRERARALEAEDRDFCMAVARQSAQALDRVRAYEALRMSRDRLEDAVRVRDEFMSIASHELRTPLTPLALQLKSLMRNLKALPEPAEVTDRLGSKVEAAVRQTNRLTSLVNSLLDVTRITAGRLELAPEELDLAALARDVVERFADELEDAGCAFTVRAEAPVRGRWDRMRVEQVVTNLLSNALKYGVGRPIGVDVRALAEGGAALEVRDQGIGISPADQARIFERFERAVSAEAYGGLGLGLYITRRIVEAHGGRIDVASAPGQGSTFTVRLPSDAPGSSGVRG